MAASSEHFQGWPNESAFQAEGYQHTPVKLSVEGRIPAYAAGTLYRTGPSQHIVKDTPKGDFKVDHWFDGFSSVHRFQLTPAADGSMEVLYNSRQNVDTLIEKIRSTGNLDQVTFAQKRDPCDGLFKKMKAVFMPARGPTPGEHNIGVTIAPDVPGIGGESSDGKSRFKTLTTFTDNASFKKLDPDTLEPLGVASQVSLHPALTGPLSAAHGNYDPVNGDILNHNLNFGRNSTYRVFKTSRATGETDILATISGPDIKPAYIHSSFITENFMVLGIQSSHIAGNGLGVLWERNIVDSISRFDPARKVVWLVVDRKHGRGLVAKFTSPACFMFHSSNAWEETAADGTTSIVCDQVEYENLDIIHRFYFENFLSTSPKAGEFLKTHRETVKPHFARYRLAGIPTTAKPSTVTTSPAERILTIDGPLLGEFPTINPEYATRPNRFLYSIVDSGKSSYFDSIAKTDLETKTSVFWTQDRHTPGEAIFVPNPEGKSEDDGVLLVVNYDGDTGKSYLLCLDARDLSEMGRAGVDGVVPTGFHGRHNKL
ncbi:hypothetical protein V494_07799 [Pseudogymnoascus sp. VKM F-4513 (FW-928)]|nr:hypothetical protein V494_07799 [Pseudogymnoascus sp. VKM F-4513 (FW-928)]